VATGASVTADDLRKRPTDNGGRVRIPRTLAPDVLIDWVVYERLNRAARTAYFQEQDSGQ